MSNPKIYVLNPPDSVTIPLKHAIQFGENVLEELVVKPMTMEHQARMKTQGNLALPMIAELASLLTGQPAAVIAVVTGEDLGKLNSVVTGFFTSSQGTGDDSSE